MSLSSSGILSAVAGAISPSQVGTYNFRLRAVDSVFTIVTFDYTLSIIPHGFDRVPSFLLDNKVENVSSQQLIDLISRLKNEKHFRHDLGVYGSPWVHDDEDVRVPDWLGPGNNVGLRSVLDAIYLWARLSMKSINLIDPDWVTRNFTIAAGTGINVSAIANGIQLSADLSGLVALAPVENEGSVGPSSTASADLSSATFLSQVLLKIASDEWYPLGTVPSNAGKRLNSFTAASNGVLGMAVGDGGAAAKLHVCWHDGVSMRMTRFDGKTMLEEEDQVIGPAAPPVTDPLVMTGNNGQVLVFFADVVGTLFYAVLNPVNYTDNTAPTYLYPAAPMALANVTPNTTTASICGAVPPLATPAAGLCYVGFNVAGLPTVAEFDTLTPQVSGGFIQAKTPGTAAILDMVVDSASSILSVICLGGLAGPADTIDLYQDTIPMPIGAMAANVGLHVVGVGSSIENGSLIIADSGNTPLARAVMLVYTQKSTGASQWPVVETFRWLAIDNTQIMGGVGPANPGTWGIDYSGLDNKIPMLKYWQGAECRSVSIFKSQIVADGEVERLIADVNMGFMEHGIIRRAKPAPNWLRGASTAELSLNAQGLRVYDDQNVLAAVEPLFTAESLHSRYDSALNKVFIVNETPFAWDYKITAIEKSGFVSPPSLLIAGWQLAQAMQNYYNDNGYYPSPSTTGANGVTWSEFELATTPTLGVLFNSYYTVVPGKYDLNNGITASAFYYSSVGAGLASDQTITFRYASYPTEIAVAEAAIKAAVDGYIALWGAIPAPVGEFYTLSELDGVLGTTFAATYAGAPYNLYRYFLFRGPGGATYHHGYFSTSYVSGANAYGPSPAGVNSVPVLEVFPILLANDTPGVPHDFPLSHGVLAARVMVNGLEYYQGIHWTFDGNNVIRYLNNPADYVLSANDRVAVWKFLPV